MKVWLNEWVMDAVKLVAREKGTIEGWGVPFGGPMNGRDMDGEAFTRATNLYLDAYEKRPLLYNHGGDDLVRWTPVGQQTKATRRERGIWVEAQIDMAKEYSELLLELLGQEMLGFSSGANPRSVAKSADGLITEWFWNELSLTPTPANPFAMVSVKSQQPVIGIKSQLAIFGELGRLPDADEALELARPYLKADPITERVEAMEKRLSEMVEARKERLQSAELARLRLEHEHIMLEG